MNKFWFVKISNEDCPYRRVVFKNVKKRIGRKVICLESGIDECNIEECPRRLI